MERKIISEEQKERLLKLKEFFEAENAEKTIYCFNDTGLYKPFDIYCEIAELDYNTMKRLDDCYKGEIRYGKSDGQFVICCTTFCNNELKDSLSIELTSEEDFLGFYSKKEEADSSLENFFNDNIENVVRKIKEDYLDVYEFIEEDIIRRIRDYDIDDSDKEYFANDWIADNPRIAVDDAMDYLCDDDKKDLIKDLVDNL